MRFLLAFLLSLSAAPLFAIGIGQPAGPFTINRTGTPAPPPLQLSEFRGKVVMLVFIDTNCAHCQDLTRTVLTPVSREYAGRGVTVLECAFNDLARQEVPKFIQQYQPPFQVGWAPRAAVMSFLQISIVDQRPLYVPHIVFLDRQGVVRAEFRGESDFFKDAKTNTRAELEKLLKPAAPAKRRTAKKK